MRRPNVYILALAFMLVGNLAKLSALSVITSSSASLGNGNTFSNVVVETNDVVVLAVASNRLPSLNPTFSSTAGVNFSTLTPTNYVTAPKATAFIGYATVPLSGTFDFTVTPSSNSGSTTKVSMYVLRPNFGHKLMPSSESEVVFSSPGDGTTDPIDFSLDYQFTTSDLGESIIIESITSHVKALSKQSGNQLSLQVSNNKRKIGSLEVTDPATFSSGWTFDPTASSDLDRRNGSGVGVALSESIPAFNIATDYLFAFYDLNADMDDVHAAAAFACMLEHPSFAGLKYYAVAGAYGDQKTKRYIKTATPDYYNVLFGNNWIEVKDRKGKTADYDLGVQTVADKAIESFNLGGNVWVQEAGQSDFTLDVLNKLIDLGIDLHTLKYRFFVVQHSDWNEAHANPGVLDQVKNLSNYIYIDSGNWPYGDYSAHSDQGIDTPSYNSWNPDIVIPGDEYGQIYLIEAMDPANPNARAREIWTEAYNVSLTWDHWHNPPSFGTGPEYSPIDEGGIDFSDCIENWFILQDDVNSVQDFWAKYVTNTPAP
ncbi:MAG: hypothetical protein AAGH40_01335 [Verrucomicrobiota bacterium]